ncbi:MAG: hypothetical protein NOOUEUKL_000964 [Candidatus Fervidibacter sp.]|jgi:Uncharacterized protein conserved in bacteria
MANFFSAQGEGGARTVLQCPVCGTAMREIERFGVLVDICPSCKGVWLDRGELDKIIQYAQSGYGDEVMAAGGYEPVAYEPPPPPPPAPPSPPPRTTRPTHSIRTINNLLTTHPNASGASLSFWKTCLSSAIDGAREVLLAGTPIGRKLSCRCFLLWLTAKRKEGEKDGKAARRTHQGSARAPERIVAERVGGL